jgi:hypothetical protein
MRFRFKAVFATLIFGGGCAEVSHVVPVIAQSSSNAVQSVCALPGLHSQFDLQRIRVRGRVGMHAHGVFLEDKNCPDYRLYLAGTKQGPDLSFCTPERLAQEFGCPGAGNQNGLIVTVSGILEPSTAPKFGTLLVEEMMDFENARTGARFVP